MNQMSSKVNFKSDLMKFSFDMFLKSLHVCILEFNVDFWIVLFCLI